MTTAHVRDDDTSARDQAAERLLAGSLRRSYDSAVDVDWDAPQDPDLFYAPPETISLYGTPLWEGMSHRERVELSRQEAANMLSRAVWFENTLNQGLLRAMLHQDPTSRHVHYALTELGDETRHMIMFGRGVAAIGAMPYRLSTLEAMTVQLFPFFYRGIFLYVAALCGEELIDDLQRNYLRHPDLQPIMAQIMRIHVTEEARHIRYARDGVRRRIQRAPWWERQLAATANGAAGFILAASPTTSWSTNAVGSTSPRRCVRPAPTSRSTRGGEKRSRASITSSTRTDCSTPYLVSCGGVSVSSDEHRHRPRRRRRGHRGRIRRSVRSHQVA